MHATSAFVSLLHSFVAAHLYSTVTARLLGFAATDLLVRQHVLMVCEVQMDFCTFTALPNTPSRKLPLRISAGCVRGQHHRGQGQGLSWSLGLRLVLYSQVLWFGRGMGVLGQGLRFFFRAMLCIRGTSHGLVSVCPSQVAVY